ncbi:MAG: PLP-dependent aminotransferase family protein [Bacteroidetes bacterium]|nr:PLP-dependent aminotransferase family protein [Bacteroidota bacterium]
MSSPVLPYKALIKLQRTSTTPVYLQIANRLIQLMHEGLLQPGAALPSSREMAALLQVHRKTIVAAYEELMAQDWIVSEERKAVMVSPDLPQTKPRSFGNKVQPSTYTLTTGFDFNHMSLPLTSMSNAGSHRLIINDGFPDARIAPIDALMKAYQRLYRLPSMQRNIIYGHLAGALSLRKELASFLHASRGVQCTAQHILVTRGAQMALFVAAQIILKPGDTVIVGEPNYGMANMVFTNCGAKLLPVPVDENGIDVDRIEAICKKKVPKLLYIIPHHHHPTTVTLSPQRRMQLLQLIRQYNIAVIEDDYDYDFHYNSSPVLPLASASHNGNVIYIGSLTKSLTTTMKVGYMVAPENFIDTALQWRRLIDIRGDNLLEEALATLFQSGVMQQHLKKSLKLYHQRRDYFCALLHEHLRDVIDFTVPAGGMATWATIYKKYSLPALAAKASAQGLFINDGKFYNTGSVNYNALRMGFASLNEKEMEEAIKVLRSVFGLK